MYALLTALLTVSSLTPTAVPGIVGVWESTRTSQGGIGRALEFRSDGTFVTGAVVMVEMRYRVEGDQLILESEPSHPSSEASPSIQLRFEGDVLLQTRPDGAHLRMQRLRRPGEGSAPIVGDWRYCHQTGVTAFERYSDSGKLILRIPMVSTTGTYRVEGTAVTLSSEKSPDNPARAKWRGESLFLPGDAEYRRAATEGWYDLSRVDRCSPADALPSGISTPTSPTPSPSVLSHVRSHPPIDSFVGVWHNVDPNTGMWTRVEIEEKKGTLRFRIFGKCHPSDCELPAATARYKGSPIVLASDVGFVKSRFIISLEGEVLRMTTEDTFTDGSGRDRVYDSRFRK